MTKTPTFQDLPLRTAFSLRKCRAYTVPGSLTLKRYFTASGTIDPSTRIWLIEIILTKKLEKINMPRLLWVDVGIDTLLSVYKFIPEMQGRLISLLVVLGGMVLSAQWLAVIILKPVKRMSETAAGITAATLHQRLEIDQLHDELKKLGIVFNTMLDGLEHSFNQQARFVSAAAHELRTPLSILRTNLEAAGDSDGIDPIEWRDYRAATERTLARLESLTEDLLLLADDTYDREHNEHKVVALADILADATSLMKPMAIK